MDDSILQYPKVCFLDFSSILGNMILQEKLFFLFGSNQKIKKKKVLYTFSMNNVKCLSWNLSIRVRFIVNIHVYKQFKKNNYLDNIVFYKHLDVLYA